MTKVHVKMSGMVHLDGVQVAIGLVQRAGKFWLAYAYGQPAKTSHHALRRDAVNWVVQEWANLGKAMP